LYDVGLWIQIGLPQVCLTPIPSPSPTSDFFHSFEPPFEEIDNTGERLVGKYWRTAGHAVVNTNFARLTPDRQSKKGALWSRKPLGVPAFSGIFKFRISGQGKNFFGDGIALWITQQAYYNPGELHGSQEKFVGVGIIFDTFRNTETLSAHRDVTILLNDGEKTFEMMTDQVIGCNANFRYHSERADFSVTDSARAKVIIKDGKYVDHLISVPAPLLTLSSLSQIERLDRSKQLRFLD
jgi:lectin, mannose-binding 2